MHDFVDGDWSAVPSAYTGALPAALNHEVAEISAKIPRGVYLGTSSWSYDGWKGIVYSELSEGRIGVDALKAYSRHPLFRTVGLDRTYYRPMKPSELSRLAGMVGDDFRFVVKAPRRICDPYERAERGRPVSVNLDFLNAGAAVEEIEAFSSGLGEKLGVVLLQLSSFSSGELSTPSQRMEIVERIGEFLEKTASASKTLDESGPTLALEVRNSELLTPRLMNALRRTGVRPVLALHPRMPNISRQIDALRFCELGQHRGERPEDWKMQGDLVMRWMLPADMTYRTASEAWEPFDRIRRPDELMRTAAASMIKLAVDSGRRAYFIANNKAEGCAPLTVEAVARAFSKISFSSRS